MAARAEFKRKQSAYEEHMKNTWIALEEHMKNTRRTHKEHTKNTWRAHKEHTKVHEEHTDNAQGNMHNNADVYVGAKVAARSLSCTNEFRSQRRPRW